MEAMCENTRPNVRCNKYLVVQSKVCCLHCGGVTKVFAISLPAGYESLTVDDETPDDSPGVWVASHIAAVLSYVENLSDAVANRIHAVAPNYRFDREDEADAAGWVNHCEHCGKALSEEELHGDMDGPFGSMPDLGLEAIKVDEVREPFEGWAGTESHSVKALDG